VATQVRRQASRFGKPRDDRANNATISNLQAEGAHGMRVKSAEKAFKGFERKLTTASQVGESQGIEAAKFGASVGRASAASGRALEQQGKSLQSLQRRQARAVEKAAKDMATDEKYASKDKAGQKAYWERYQKRLPESISLRKATRAYEAAVARANAANQSNQSRMNSYNSRINAANKRTQRLNRRYIAALDKYKRVSKVVRWTP